MTDRPTFGGKKLLSICINGRDDDYIPDFKYRLATTLNYITRNLVQLARRNDVEILVTDWGSEVPLVESLALSPDASEICRFIYVPPAVLRAVQGGKDDFHTSLAANVGIRRALGEFVLLTPGDTLIPRHALDTIVRISESSLGLSIRAEETMFLCPRYHIPWQFVERQPGLEAWDRYLLLSGSELNYDNFSMQAVSGGVGGFLMHRDLWQKVRGLDEQFGGWGFQDIDLGLRVSQICPWLGLSSLGVNFYHMGHAPVGRRVDAVAAGNPLKHNWNVTVNGDGWGLADFQLQEQRSGRIWAHNTIAVAEPDHVATAKSKERIEEIVGGLATAPVLELVNRSIKLFPNNSVQRDELEALVFLAWHSASSHPRCYLEFGIRRGYALAVVAAANPGIEVYGFDEWQGVVSDDTEIIRVASKLRSELGHRAYVRFMNGPLHTGVARLRKSFVGQFCPDLVFVRGDRLGEHLREQVANLLSHLAPGGAIVITSTQAEAFNSLWAEWRKQCPQCVLFLSKSGHTGMILSDKLLIDALGDSTHVNCDFDFMPILEPIASRPLNDPGDLDVPPTVQPIATPPLTESTSTDCDVAPILQSVAAPPLADSNCEAAKIQQSDTAATRVPTLKRALRALSQPGRYPEFAARLLLRIVRRQWPH